MGHEIITVSEVSQTKTNTTYHLYMESNKNDTKNLFMKHKQTHKLLLWNLGHMKIPRQLGSNQGCGCRPIPQPQPHGIWALSVTYTVVCGNAQSLTHWVRAGIELASSGTLCQVLNPLGHNRNSSIIILNTHKSENLHFRQAKNISQKRD